MTRHPVRIQVLVLATSLAISATVSASSVVIAGGSDVPCLRLGRLVTDVAWSPDGDQLAIVTEDRTTSDVRVIEWPAMTSRIVDAGRDLGFGHGSVAIDAAGMVSWTGEDAQGPAIWTAGADGTTVRRVGPEAMTGTWTLDDLAWTESGLVALRYPLPPSLTAANDLLRLAPDGRMTTETAGLPQVRSMTATPEGTLLLERSDRTTGWAWSVERDGTSTTIDDPGGIFAAGLDPTGRRVLYARNGGGLGWASRDVDGTDLVAERMPEGADGAPAIRGDGVVAIRSYGPEPMGSGPSLPSDGPSWTPIADLCFALASWADPGTTIPPMPEPVAITPVRFVDLPPVVERTFGSLPRSIGDVPLRYETRSNRPDRGIPRVSDATFDLMIPRAVVAAGADPDLTWMVRAFPEGSTTPLLTAVSGRHGPGSRWMRPIAMLLGRDPAVTRTDVTIAGRRAVHVSGLSSSDAFMSLVWPGTDTWILSIGRTAYVITTDDAELAADVVQALSLR